MGASDDEEGFLASGGRQGHTGRRDTAVGQRDRCIVVIFRVVVYDKTERRQGWFEPRENGGSRWRARNSDLRALRLVEGRIDDVGRPVVTNSSKK